MADLKLLTDRLMENERSKTQVLIKEAEKEAEEILRASDEALKDEKQKRQERIQTEQKAQYEQDKNALSNKRRNELLTVKQHALTDVFDSAKERMEQLDNTEFQQFLTAVLGQYQDKEVDLILGEKSQSLVSPEFISELKETTKTTVHLKEETIAKTAGFIIRHNGIDYNYTFDALIDDIKEDVLPTVSQKLFQ